MTGMMTETYGAVQNGFSGEACDTEESADTALRFAVPRLVARRFPAAAGLLAFRVPNLLANANPPLVFGQRYT